jgi:hypothetical protein
LFDLCTITDTLIGDADRVFNPALFNDRLLLGLKSTMSEAELHTPACVSRRRHPEQGARRATTRPANRNGLGPG